jgi:hypothetical protein
MDAFLWPHTDKNERSCRAWRALVKEVSYEVTDPTVDSQIIELQGVGVDALIIAATSKPAAQTIRKVYDLGWTPERYLRSAIDRLRREADVADCGRGRGSLGRERPFACV